MKKSETSDKLGRPGKKIRLDKFLADSNQGARSQVKEWIQKGLVRVGETTVKDPGFKIKLEEEVYLRNERANYQRYYYIMMHKPAGVISASRQGEKNPRQSTVIDLLGEKYKSVPLFPVGRLDKDTTGLLIITNDGAFAHETLSPAKHVTKTYIATVDAAVTAEDAEAFAHGVVLDGDVICKPATLTVLSSECNQIVKIEITEGKYHQIKRMFASRGKAVLSLKRIGFGGLFLDESLQPGQWRELLPEEKNILNIF